MEKCLSKGNQRSASHRHYVMADLMEEFHDGPHATPGAADEGPIYLGIKNLTDEGRLDLSSIRHISTEEFEKWTRRVTPRPNDVVFTYEATLHRYALIPDGFVGCLGRRLALIRPRLDRVDPRFLHLTFLGPEWRRTITDRTLSGSTVDRIPIAEFPTFPISLPPLGEQRRIAAVLSAFDELIEINERRATRLEELATGLYSACFTGAPATDAAWGLTTLGQAATWLSGGTPSTKDPAFWGGEIPWISSGSLVSMFVDQSDRCLTEAGAADKTTIVDRDALLFVVRGMSLAKEFRVGIAERKLAFGQDCKALIATNGVDPLYLAFSVITRARSIQAMVEFAGHGTGKLATDRLKAIEIPLPPIEQQKAFAERVNVFRNSAASLRQRNRQLAATRDLLLPRLVTGRLDISEIDLGALTPAEVE